jgi:hypothetical protein
LPFYQATPSTAEIRDTIEENVPVHWQTKYENADLNLETIAELTGYFTRLEDLDKKREKASFKTSKDSEKINKKYENNKVQTIGREHGKGNSKPNEKETSKYCIFHKSNTHDTSECEAKKKFDLVETHKRQMLLHLYLITSVTKFQQASSLLPATMDLMSTL